MAEASRKEPVRGIRDSGLYSLVTGLDIPGGKVTVANPYGYMEELTLDEFLKRTRFDAYENMPLFLKLDFAFGVFEKNTVFVPERIG